MTEKNRTKADIERELNVKKERIEQRLMTLQEEVTTVVPSMGKAVVSHPLFKVGGALLAGLVVGLLAGGKKRSKDAFGAGADHRALVDHYVAAIIDEAGRRVDQGQDMDQAVRAALHDRVPLIVYEVPDEPARSTMISRLMSLALYQVVPRGIQMGIDYLMGETPDEAGDDAPDEV